MRPFERLISFEDARRVVEAAAVPIDRTERIPLSSAAGRVLAADVTASVDVPPFDRAAMDGYAVVARDTAGASRESPAVLACVHRLFTGDPGGVEIRAGECAEIATGAPMPAGADAVVMVEDTSVSGPAVQVYAAVAPGQHVGRRGADIGLGQQVLVTGQELGPARVGALAALGRVDADVFVRPSVAIVSTGNELAAPGEALGAGQIYDINRFTLEAVAARHGGAPVLFQTPGDRLEDLLEMLAAAARHDLVVLSGGSSVGDRDLVADAVRARGEVLFHGVAVKPGKPTLFGRLGATPILGMPGYPASCLSNAYLFLVPLLRRTARLPPWRPETRDLPLARPVRSVPGRHQFYTVRIANGQAEPAFKASGDITSMAHADGYFEIPADVTAVPAGTTVRVTLF